MNDDLVKRLREYEIHLDAWGKEAIHDADIVEEAADRIEKLEAALRNVTTTWGVWQKEKDSNSFTELFASICEAKALEGKDAPQEPV